MTDKEVDAVLAQLKTLVKTIEFGNITLIVQDGHIIQIEKNEKFRLK